MRMRTRSIVIAIGAGALMALISPALPQQKFSQRDYDRKAAPEFLFEHSLFGSPCSNRSLSQQENAGPLFDGPLPFPNLNGHFNAGQDSSNEIWAQRGYALHGSQRPHSEVLPRQPYTRTRLKRLTIPRFEAPALTVVTDVGPTMIKIAGQQREDWALRFCSEGEGASETEAQTRMEDLTLVRNGALVSVAGRTAPFVPNARGDLRIDAPAGAPVIIYASVGAIVIYDMTGTVRTAAPHGRTTILNSTGRMDATGADIDFGGEKGTVTLDASAEINMKLTSTTFQGSISAHADRAVRMLLPPGFATPIEAIVARRKDFVCRADLCAHVKPEKKNGLYYFTFAGNGNSSPSQVSLHSEHATVVIDTASKP